MHDLERIVILRLPAILGVDLSITNEILLLWAAILATTTAFARQSRLAGGLLVPYLLWVSFAAVLNFGIWRLNL